MESSKSLGLSNTQAERTRNELHKILPLRVLIDWLSFTFLDEEFSITNALEVFEDYLGIEKHHWQAGRRNYEGYADSFVFENINIYYNGSQNQGIHCSITGQGCRFIEILYQKLGVQEKNWYDFIKTLRTSYNLKFTRIDIACDDFHGHFTIDQIYEKLLAGHVKSKFKSWHSDCRMGFDGQRKGGLTIYFGSPQSRLQCTMYEKNKQLNLDYFWLRTELRFQKQRAEDIATSIIYNCNPLADKTKDVGLIFAGVLKEYLNFLEPNLNDSNKRRWNTSVFWENFLAGVTPLRFASDLPDRDIQKIHGWWQKQVSKSLTMLTLAYHDNYEDWLRQLFEDGKQKLKAEDIRIINDYRRLHAPAKESLLETDIFTQSNKKESSWAEDSQI